MTPSDTTDYALHVDLRAVIGEEDQNIQIRRNDGVGLDAQLWIKPDGLDADGEFAVTLGNLVTALRSLGFNHADLWVDD